MSGVLKFLHFCGALKKLKRTGWVNNKVHDAESVADHMYRMAMCAMLIQEERDKVNQLRCIKMAIVHDLAESIVGDITPHDGVSNEEKHRREKDAIHEICSHLDSDHSEEILSLWNEYEEGKTAEAILVKDFDKFEMILQADEYERDQQKDLEPFFISTKEKFKTPLVKSWVDELNKQRKIRLNILEKE